MKPFMLLAVLAMVGCAGAPPRQPTAQEKAEVDRIKNLKVAPERTKGPYRIVMKGGEKKYCTKELATGSHVNFRTICLTETEYLAMQDKAQQQMDDMRSMPLPADSVNGLGKASTYP
jgi:hypothetical protein